jgi:hypothetical protein
MQHDQGRCGGRTVVEVIEVCRTRRKSLFLKHGIGSGVRGFFGPTVRWPEAGCIYCSCLFLPRVIASSALANKFVCSARPVDHHLPVTPVVMIPVAMMIVMMVPVTCFDDIAASRCYSLWKGCNGRSVRCSVSGHESDRCEYTRKQHSFHFLTSLRSESPPCHPSEACVPEWPLNRIKLSNF